jgi:hypothetical protein
MCWRVRGDTPVTFKPRKSTCGLATSLGSFTEQQGPDWYLSVGTDSACTTLSLALMATTPSSVPGTVVAVVGVDTLQNAEFKLPEEERKQILDGVEKDFKGTVRMTFAGLLPEKADTELKKWLQAKAEGQDPKMALALMRDLFDLDTVMAFKEAKVPVRCINSAGGYQLFPPPSRPTRSTPTSVRSSSKAPATTRCWRSQTSSTPDSVTCSRSLRPRCEPVSPGTRLFDGLSIPP